MSKSDYYKIEFKSPIHYIVFKPKQVYEYRIKCYNGLNRGGASPKEYSNSLLSVSICYSRRALDTSKNSLFIRNVPRGTMYIV